MDGDLPLLGERGWGAVRTVTLLCQEKQSSDGELEGKKGKFLKQQTNDEICLSLVN